MAIQPYQRGLPTFAPGQALTNMVAGRDIQGGNPQDLWRMILHSDPGALAQLVAQRGRRPVGTYPLAKAPRNAIPYR